MDSSNGTVEIWVILHGDEPTSTAVRSALAGEPGFEVKRRAWPGRAERMAPDVLIAGTDPPESLIALRERLDGPSHRPAVVLITETADLDAARRGLVAGADAVLLTTDLDRALIAAVRAATAGLLILSPRLSHAIARPSLTAREKQILAMVVMGMTNQEIADRLVVAPSTVKSHLFSAYRRLGVRTRKEAVALITDPDRGLGSGILALTET